MNENRVPILFEDMSYHTEYSFLELGKDDAELTEVAKKAGIVYPSPDIAIFKGRYALVDKQNRNRCTLPKEEVEKALQTLNHKAVDIDHLRRYTVGSWLYGYMDGNEVITYGLFWKSNYAEEYNDFKGRMNRGEGLKISMEAWGNRIDKADKSGYSLVDIHFAGGALLDKEQPAEPTAGVLEFAKIMEKNATKTEDPKTLEKARYYIWDLDAIMRLCWEAKNPKTGEQGAWEIQSIDFKNSKVVLYDYLAENSVEVSLTPQTKDLGPDTATHKSSREILSIKEVKINKSTIGGNEKMEEKIKELEASLKAKDAEIAKLTKEVEEAKTAIETSKKALTDEQAKLKALEDSIPAKVKDAQEQAKKVAERRAELTEEFAKEMTDEQILNDDKFENAKLRKQVADLKDPEKATKQLEAGSKNKEVTSDPSLNSQKKAQELAFGPVTK